MRHGDVGEDAVGRAALDAELREEARRELGKYGLDEFLEGLRFGDVEVDPKTRSVERNGQEVQLAPKEYELLLALLLRRGEVISRVDLLREVWGHAGRVLTRTVDTHVAQLRRKLERDPSRPDYILTVRKVGYRLRV